MTSQIVEIQPTARRDINTYVLWLREEADAEVAERFARAAIATFGKLAETPMMAPAIETRNPQLIGLRKWKVDGFPRMLIFYRPVGRVVQVVRVLHSAQDWWSLLDTD